MNVVLRLRAKYTIHLFRLVTYDDHICCRVVGGGDEENARDIRFDN